MKKVIILFGIVLILSSLVIVPKMLGADPSNQESHKFGNKSSPERIDDSIYVDKFGQSISRTTSTSRLYVTEAGTYYFKMSWYNAAAITYIYLDSPIVNSPPTPVYLGYYAGTTGYEPAIGTEIELGYFDEDDEIIVKILSYWHSAWYGPKYSWDTDYFDVDPITTGWDYFYETEITDGWKFVFEDAVGYNMNYDDGRFEIYAKEEAE